MTPGPRPFGMLGAAFAGTAVLFGAFAAHALQTRVSPADLAAFETGARYQMYHGLALLAVSWTGGNPPSGAARWAGRLFGAGIVLFSGSLYLMVLTGARWLGAVTPLGGVAFLAGWAALLLAARRS